MLNFFIFLIQLYVGLNSHKLEAILDHFEEVFLLGGGGLDDVHVWPEAQLLHGLLLVDSNP